MAESSKTADHALAVLLELAASGATSPAELARRLDLNRTVVHRLLTTLHGRGFVTRGESGYALGAVLLRIADRVQPELRNAATGIMAELAREVDETVVLHTLDGDDAVVLEQQVASWHVLRVEHEIGSRHSLSQGASGRAMLAFLLPETLERLRKLDDDPVRLDRQLEQTRVLGYALSHDELQHGVHGIAVPVYDRPGHALASLAIIAPATRAGGIERTTDALQDAARRIAVLLGFDGGLSVGRTGALAGH